MSEYDDDARQAAATEPSATEPVSQPAQNTDQSPDADQVTPDETPKPETKAPDPRDRAIRQLAFEQRETRRQLAAAQQRLEALQPRDPHAPPAQVDVERMIEERAQALIASRETQAKQDAWIAAGTSEYPDFNDRCNVLADMGAAENASFMQAISRIPAAHKVIAELATDPAEATRILKLSPIDMALELAGKSSRIATAPAPAPKPTSSAPPPIKPITATARAEVTPDKMSEAEFQKWWNKKTRG